MIVEIVETEIAVLGGQTGLQQVGGQPIVRQLLEETVVQQVEQAKLVLHQVTVGK